MPKIGSHTCITSSYGLLWSFISHLLTIYSINFVVLSHCTMIVCPSFTLQASFNLSSFPKVFICTLDWNTTLNPIELLGCNKRFSKYLKANGRLQNKMDQFWQIKKSIKSPSNNVKMLIYVISLLKWGIRGWLLSK